MTGSAPGNDLPVSPFPGIDPYSYAHRKVFFAREAETRTLIRLVVMYRGVLLYSDSGAGKSSLLNAGLIPSAIEEGFQPERVRVQPRAGEEIIVERISENPAGGPPFLPSVFPFEEGQHRVVLSIEEFLETVHWACQTVRPLLIFDQFEEWITLFEEGSPEVKGEEAAGAKQRIRDAIASLINDRKLPVKVLIALREDYLAKLHPLFQSCPQLPDQYLRLIPLSAENVYQAVRGPFERYPGHYRPELSPALAARVRADFETRSGAADIRLTEVQIVCQSLFEADERKGGPEKLFEDQGGVQGILERYLERALRSLPPDQREPAVALLTRMLTSAGTRNVISQDDLVHRVASEEELPRRLLNQTLDSLEQQAKLVRREPRREVYYCEIASEFLVSWIREKALERERLLALRKQAAARRVQDEARARKRLRNLVAALAGGALVLIVGATIAFWQWQRAEGATEEAQKAEADARTAEELAKKSANDALTAKDAADKEREKAEQLKELADARGDELQRLERSGRLAAAAVNNLGVDPERSLLLALQAVAATQRAGQAATNEAEDALRHAVQTSRVRLTLDTYGSPAAAVAFSPDGTRLATAHNDSTARVWDAHSGRELYALYGHTDRVNAVAFDPEGAHLATASEDGTAIVWEAHTGRPLRTLSAHVDGVNAIAFSPDGTRLATASDDGTAMLWEVRTGRRLHTLSGHFDSVEDVAFSRDGRRVATAGSDRTAIIWDVASGYPTLTLSQPQQQLKAVAFDPSGSRLVTAGFGGELELWDATSGRRLHSVAGHTNLVLDLTFSPDGARIATASYDATVKVWDADLRQELFTLAGHTHAVYGVAFSPRGGGLATASLDGTVRVWSAESEELPALAGHSGKVNDVAFGRNGALLATAGDDDTARLWEPVSGKQLRTFSGHKSSVVGVALSPDGRQLATASADGTARVWDAASGRELFPLKGHQRRVRRIAFSPDGRRLATASDDGTAKLWDAASGRHVRDFSGHQDEVRAVAFSPDGRLLATASNDRTAKLWDLDSAQTPRTLQGHIVGLLDVAFSPDGKRLATASKDKKAIVWDVASGKEVLTLSGHTDTVMEVAFSPDNRFIATASSDKSVRLWDATSGRELRTIVQSTSELEALAFSADGRRLAVAGDNKFARVYVLAIEDLLSLARSRLTRPFTAEECRLYLGGACPVTAQGLRAEGRQLAANAKLRPAVDKLRQAAQLDPSLHLDPETEANKWLAARAFRLAPRMAEEARSEDDFGKAFTLLAVARKDDPTITVDPERHLRRLVGYRLLEEGRDLARKGSLSQASLRFRRALSLDSALTLDANEAPKRLRAQALFREGLESIRGNRGEQAIERFREVLSLDPQHVAAYRFLAMLYEEKPDHDQAIACLRAAVKSAPHRLDLHVMLGDLLLRRKDYPGASALARKILDLNPNYGCAYVLLGQAESGMDRHEEAVRAFRMVQDTDPCYEGATSLAGVTYHEHLHRYDIAYLIYTQALARDPNYCSHVSNLAEVSLAAQRFAEARRLALRVLAGPPQVSEAPTVSVGLAMRFVVLTSLLLQGQPGEARAALRQLLDHYNSEIESYRSPEWRYDGTEYFIRQHSMPENTRRLLLKLLEILKAPAGPVKPEQFAFP